MTPTATAPSKPLKAAPEPPENDEVKVQKPQDNALIGTGREITLFPKDDFKVESSEAVLGAITVKVDGQFDEQDEFNIVIPVRVVNVITDSRSKTRRHVLYGTEIRRFVPGDAFLEKGEEPGEEEQK